MYGDSLIVLIIVLAVAIGIFILTREFWNWYWKNNEMIEILKRIEAKLDPNGLGPLENESSAPVSTEADQPNPPQPEPESSSEEEIPEDWEYCPHCGIASASYIPICGNCGKTKH